jgi:glycosyltransferase involved in cell wall biosynthesis
MRCPTLDQLPSPPHGKTGWPWTEDSPQLPERMQDGCSWPRISIVTPSYIQGSYLEETIRSVLLQGYPDLEYFIIDGGSTDESVDLIRKYEPWLTSWVTEKDRGQSHAINKGWAKSTGDLIAYLNSDDFYFPATLQRVGEAIKMDRSIAMVTGAIAITDQSSRVMKERVPHLNSENPVDLSLLEPSAWFLPQQSSFFVREYVDQVGRWLREELHYTMDRELMYRLSMSGKIILLRDVLAGDRQHSESKRLSQTLQMYREDARALEYCTWGNARTKSQRKRIARWRVGQGHFRYADQSSSRVKTIVHLLIAASYRPSYLKRRSFQKLALRSIGILKFIEVPAQTIINLFRR